MNEMVTQKKLADAQIEAFYHDEFVEDQVRDFGNLNDRIRAARRSSISAAAAASSRAA